MTFDEVLRQVLDLLQRQGRVSYRALRRQFDVDDGYLEDLKEALCFVHPQIVDEEGRGLVWADDFPVSGTEARRRTEAEMRFYALLPGVMWLLQREGRVTYRTLKHTFGVDDAFLQDVRRELTFRRLAIDEDGKGLVWTGEIPPTVQREATIPSSPATADTTAVASSPVAPILPPPVTETRTPCDEPTVPPEAMSTDVPHAEPTIIPEPTHTAPEAERRHLTVMFCDLADSTTLAQQLDPEDLREVIRAYHQTSADVINHFDGYIAQHLGDGLLIYFGWPIAHEDDAQRALHAGLGLVEAITTTLNPRLEQEKGVQLTVRLGMHTGPVVVGEMGGGGRHENLATGETVNIAARLEGLAAPNTVVISQATARLVVAHAGLAQTLYYMGEFASARMHAAQGIALADPGEQRALALRYGASPGVYCLHFAAAALWTLGYPDQARQRSQEACALAHELSHPPSLAVAQHYATLLHLFCRDAHTAHQHAEAVMTIATEHGLPHWMALATFNSGCALAMRHQREADVAQMRQGFTDTMARGVELARPRFLALLAEVHRQHGQVDEGLHVLAETMTAVTENGQDFIEAETYRLKGALLLQQPVPDASQAETCFQQALSIARAQQAKSWELRAATSLARLWQSQGKRQEATDLLAPVYEWFTEGFDTADVQEATALLSELSENG